MSDLVSDWLEGDFVQCFSLRSEKCGIECKHTLVKSLPSTSSWLVGTHFFRAECVCEVRGDHVHMCHCVCACVCVRERGSGRKRIFVCLCIGGLMSVRSAAAI